MGLPANEILCVWLRLPQSHTRDNHHAATPSPHLPLPFHPACPSTDMVRMGDVNEATILHNLRARFLEDTVYTNIGEDGGGVGVR